MTVAQKLYASSGAPAAPMINTNSITSLSTSVDAASTPSPPPTSNRISMLSTLTSTSALRSSSRPMSYMPQSRSSVQSTRINPHNNNHPGAALYASARESSVDVLYSSNNRGDHNPHRAATAPALPVPTATTNGLQERFHSQSVGSVAPNAYSRPRPTPHLVTKASAPPSYPGAQPGRVDLPTSPLSPLIVQSTSPPSTSLLFSKPAENLSPSSYIRPGSSLSDTITPHNTHTYNHFGLGQQSNQLGRIDATLGTGLDPNNLLAMLKLALAVNPIAESELRAVAYAQPNANYQAVVNALKHQQRYRPVTSTQVQLPSGMGIQHHPTMGSVDYQLLITEVGKLEIKSTLAPPQQVQIAQQQQSHLNDFNKQQEAALAQLHQQSILNQQTQGQAFLNSHLHQQQNTALAQQQALLIQNQQAQEHAMKLQLQQQQQQQQAAFAQQQVALNQQTQEQALKFQLQQQQQQQAAVAQQQAILKQQAEEQAAMKMQLQQQQMLASQQTLMQANQINQQQLHVLQQQQASQQQLLAQQSVPVNYSQPHQPTSSAPNHYQGGQQQQQQQQSGLGNFMNSVMGGPQQQTGGPSTSQQVVSHLFDSVVNSVQADPSANGATSCDAGNQGLMDSITQSFNGFNGGGQDPSSGLFGASINLDFSSMGNTDFSTVTSSVDFSGFTSGMDFGSGDC
jgi:hypothetical protein